MAKITGPQARQLRIALQGAFMPNQFDLMLQDFLDTRMVNIARLNVEYPYQLQDVIDHYNMRNSVERLIRAAMADNPNDDSLRKVAETLRIGAEFTPEAFSDDELQRTINKGVTFIADSEYQRVIDKGMGFLDGRQFRERWGRIERQVCRIEFPEGQHQGSGFLVASDVLITNYHVMKPIIDNPTRAAEVVVRFDYLDNTSGQASTTVKLAADWLIDHSPMSPKDPDPSAFNDLAPDQLDYTLVRLASKIGDQPPTGASSSEGRGWIKPKAEAHDFQASPFLALVQYPKDYTLRSTWDNQAFKELNANGTRVRYRANTESGSSGSPCFNINWELVALHHIGGSRLTAAQDAFNQGIPFTKILDLLQQRGLKDVLGK
jgi:V8-like Glu-specific endopeptidase